VKETTPTDFSLITYLWVWGLAIMGGIVSYHQKVRRGNAKYSIAEFLGEVVTSAFAGVLTFYLCQASGIGQLLTAALVGVSGHMGSRALAILERMLKDKIKG
jgi:hypothetical protein